MSALQNLPSLQAETPLKVNPVLSNSGSFVQSDTQGGDSSAQPNRGNIIKQDTRDEDSFTREDISDSLRIAVLFERLKHNRVILGVVHKDMDDRFTSTLLKIDLRVREFYIDELMPRNGQRYVVPGSRLYFSANQKGFDLGFEAQVIELRQGSKAPYIALAFPKVVSNIHRRSHHRVSASYARSSRVSIELDNGQTCTGVLRDLSVGGIKIVFNNDLERMLAEDTTITRCRIHTPEQEEPIQCEIDKCFISKTGNRPGVVLRAKFSSLGNRMQARVERFIATLGRQLAKNTSHDKIVL
jgi:c-di-GMP-binding flagellar brake protein YcgR